jgi:hypothetical protein
VTQFSSQAQQRIGVTWEPPASESQALAELRQFQELGVSILELQKVPSDQLWTAIEEHEMTVYGKLGLSFPTASILKDPDSTFRTAIDKKVQGFLSHPSAEGIQLFEFGAIQQPYFRQQLTLFFSQYDSLNNSQTYYLDNRLIDQGAELSTDFMIYNIAPSAHNFRSLTVPENEAIDGFRYDPSGELTYLLTPLKQFMEQLNHPDKLLFFKGSWLLTMVEQHPRLSETLQSFSSDGALFFPVPVESIPAPSQPHLAIILLLLVWLSLGYHYHMSPLYRKSFFRYFMGHTFFINDIFRRHIRSPIPSLVILGQHALLTSAAFYAVFNSLWSPLGIQALSAHYPTLFFSEGEPYIIFILALSGIISFSLVSTLWLYFSHKSFHSVTQLMTLVAWPLQVNFMLSTVVIALYVAEGSIHMILLFTALVILTLMLSFLIAAWDASQSLSTQKVKYLGLTAGLYLTIILGVTIWIVGFNTPFWEVMDLSLKLT